MNKDGSLLIHCFGWISYRVLGFVCLTSFLPEVISKKKIVHGKKELNKKAKCLRGDLDRD